MRIVIQSGGSSGEDSYATKPGARCCTVMAGSLGLELNDTTPFLGQGDSFAFEGMRQVRFCEGQPALRADLDDFARDLLASGAKVGTGFARKDAPSKK